MSTITDFEDRPPASCWATGPGPPSSSAPDNDVSGCTTRSSAPTAPGPATSGRPPAASAEPTRPKTVNERLHYMKMKGRDVYKFAVIKMQQVPRRGPRANRHHHRAALAVVPHQSNRGSSSRSPPKSSAAREQGGPVNIDRYGNTLRGVDSARVGRGLENGPRTPGTGCCWPASVAGLTWGTACFGFNRGSCARCRQPQYSLPAKVPRLPAWAGQSPRPVPRPGNPSPRQ